MSFIAPFGQHLDAKPSTIPELHIGALTFPPMATARVHRFYASGVQGHDDIRDAQVDIYPAAGAYRWDLVRLVSKGATLFWFRKIDHSVCSILSPAAGGFPHVAHRPVSQSMHDSHTRFSHNLHKHGQASPNPEPHTSPVLDGSVLSQRLLAIVVPCIGGLCARLRQFARIHEPLEYGYQPRDLFTV